ncbi:germination protein [Marinithermofilum abyssi]|uniref:Germination protein n=1 Tax=Marinithermofilum abyssi TaxID=1571185 RepID=A0A8J2Y8I0_9BACL|nr:GerAB/ArcD/ProY family transporter [Marinithermofilum abyssi]GGE04380.1 germination protein [Marinithermofilum abyssi]
MTSEKSSISPVQMALFIIQTQIGVGILSLPSKVHMIAKGGGWISVLISGIVVQVLIFIMWALMKRFPNSTVYEISSQIFGNFLGKVVNFAYTGYFITVGVFVMVSFSDVLNRWMLPKTPRWAVLVLMVVAGIYLARGNIRMMARYYVLTSFLILLLILLVTYGFVDVDFTLMFPIQEAGWGNIVKASKDTFTAMYGFEMLLLIYPFVEGKSRGKLKAAFFANLFVTLSYTFTVFICLIAFNPEQLRLISEPVLYLIRRYQLYMVHRPDLIFINIWATTIIVTAASYYYAAATGLASLFGSRNHSKWVPYAVLCCFVVSLIPQTSSGMVKLSKFVDIAAYVFLHGLPLMLLVLSYLLKKKERGTA